MAKMDHKLAVAVNSQIIQHIANHEAEIIRKAVMDTDNPLTASEISRDRLNQASAYFTNILTEIREGGNERILALRQDLDAQ